MEVLDVDLVNHYLFDLNSGWIRLVKLVNDLLVNSTFAQYSLRFRSSPANWKWVALLTSVWF